MESLTPTKRTILFLTVCIGLRIVIALIARVHPMIVVPFAAAISIGLFSVYLTGIRNACPESGSNGPCWWNNLRPLHGSLYALFVILALQKNPYAWYILVLDVVIGLIAFTLHKMK